MITLSNLTSTNTLLDKKPITNSLINNNDNNSLLDKKDFILQTKDQMMHKNNTLYSNQSKNIKNALLGK